MYLLQIIALMYDFIKAWRFPANKTQNIVKNKEGKKLFNLQEVKYV